MKQNNKLAVILITLAVTILFAVLAGGSIRKLFKGPAPFEEYSGLEEAQDSYLSYDVTHPVASFPAEYYSGDPDRIRKMAYVVYDETQQAFLKIVVAEQDKSGMERLLRAANMSEAMKQEWGENLEKELYPVTVTGSLTPLSDSADIKEILDAMAAPSSESTESMDAIALAQTKWYVLEDGYIGGISFSHILICTAAMALNLLFLLIALLSLLAGAGKGGASQNDGSSLSQFLKQTMRWLEPWCLRGRKRQTWMALAAIAGTAAALSAIGYFVGYSPVEIGTCHLPLGFIFGELYGLTLLLSMGRYTPEKNLKLYRRNLEKSVVPQSGLEEVSQDLLEADEQWSVHESGKEGFHHAIVGKHYWALFSENGGVTILDSGLVKRIQSEVDSGQIRVGRVRTNYTYYRVYFYFQETEGKNPDRQMTFQSSDAAGHFLTLIRKRLGDQAGHILQ